MIPSEDPHRPQYKWMSDHSQNLSGTPSKEIRISYCDWRKLMIFLSISRPIYAILNRSTENRSMATTKKMKNLSIVRCES